jgi:hypothetical protein
MGKVRTGLAVSLDEFISGPNDGAAAPMGQGGERLVAWYAGGDTDYRMPGTDMVFKVSAQTAEFLRETRETTGALVFGRKDLRPHPWVGWPPPLGCPGSLLSAARSPKHGFMKDRRSRCRRRSRERRRASQSGRRRQGRRRGRRQHRAAVPPSGTPGRAPPRPGAGAARGRRQLVRPPRHRADRPGAHAGDRGRWGDAPDLPRHKVKDARSRRHLAVQAPLRHRRAGGPPEAALPLSM